MNMVHNPHPSYQPFEVTVRRPGSTDDDMVTGFVYICSDQHGAPRYVGSTHDIAKRMERNQSFASLHSPLYRYLQEHGIDDGWQIHEYAAVHYDKTRCPDSLRRAEDDCIRQLKADGCQLLNKNAALRTNAQGVAQKAWREAHGQGPQRVIWQHIVGSGAREREQSAKRPRGWWRPNKGRVVIDNDRCYIK
jgi:hypothetical protein